ncbi:MAG: hypothetical protein NZ840_07650 [Anaerolineales bacterium]|nr:hypothetical protein [Anaerolineales bacterium]MDW8161913.1 hypothetical protein [Anaerolineales bacterium]
MPEHLFISPFPHSVNDLQTTVDEQRFSIPIRGLSLAFLFASAFLYCLPALRAPFWGSGDAWSNLLPVVHYRSSILEKHTLPLYTDLWYGGRPQWQNPLWNFLYLPATLLWLLFPLDVGTRLVYLAHLWFTLWAAYCLASLFLAFEFGRIASAILLTAPVLSAYLPAHTEKILSWGWVLWALYFFFRPWLPPLRRGLFSGLCVGVIPLTGSNYYAFYALLLMGSLLVAAGERKTRLGFLLAASIGLLHLPSVWHLIGQTRGNPDESVFSLGISLSGILLSLAFGVTKPLGWESWSPIGLPTLYLFLKLTVDKVRRRQIPASSELALLVSMMLFILLATATLYRGHSLLDTFRVPMRALPFVALTMLLLLLLWVAREDQRRAAFFFVLAAIQVSLVSLLVRPTGSSYSPYDPQAQALADLLKSRGAKQVWLPSDDAREMYLHVALNRNGIGLPNVYYGDMGQEPAITGRYCGYGFDHLITRHPIRTQQHYLKPDLWWTTARGMIARQNLEFVEKVSLYGRQLYVYRVICDGLR